MLLTRLPLGIATSFDLHVLGTPPALILSQDQTLHKNSYGALKVALKIHNAISGPGVSRSACTLRCVASGNCTFSRFSKDIADYDLVLEVGDPQTYALLHCSVFKERTPEAKISERGSFRPRYGDQAPGVTTAIISPWTRCVKREAKVFFAAQTEVAGTSCERRRRFRMELAPPLSLSCGGRYPIRTLRAGDWFHPGPGIFASAGG